MVRKTIDPEHEELRALLEGLLGRNEDISARAVARLHSLVKDASGITRHPERRKLLETYQQRQQEFRTALGSIRRSGTAAVAAQLEAANTRIRELEDGQAARIASHVAMIHAVAEIGGAAKLHEFYKRFAPIRDRLAQDCALPAQFLGDEIAPKVSKNKSKK